MCNKTMIISIRLYVDELKYLSLEYPLKRPFLDIFDISLWQYFWC